MLRGEYNKNHVITSELANQRVIDILALKQLL